MLLLGGYKFGQFRSDLNKDFIANLAGKITNHCLRLTAEQKVLMQNDRWEETQEVLFSQFK